MYSLEVNKLAMALSVPLIDIRSHFLKRKDYSDLICADGIHPNQEGHRLITNAIDTAVDRFIATNAITL
jgi:lysophospholipase L1-like esterase